MLLRLVMCVLLLFDRELLVQKKSSLLWVPLTIHFAQRDCDSSINALSRGLRLVSLGGPPFEVT